MNVEVHNSIVIGICSNKWSMVSPLRLHIQLTTSSLEVCAALLDVVSLAGERNSRSFEDCERTIVELKLLFFRTLFEWV